MKINDFIEEYQSIWFDENNIINAIDQRKLPFVFEVFQAKTLDEVCFAIRDMVVRGAPLIGVTAAFGLLQVVKANVFSDNNELMKTIASASSKLCATRPTAVDLFNVVKRVQNKLDNHLTITENISIIENETEEIVSEVLLECQKIGEIGNEIIPKKANVMTICNAGALATVDIGTALAPIRKAHELKKEITVFVNETRPRMQGARLTAWELYNEGIKHYIISDNVAGSLMQQGNIDLVIAGADRIVLNGDVANKIGTYTLSVLCKEHRIPFYIAAPKSTFDTETSSGKDIIIEKRDPAEVQKALSINDENDKEPKKRIIHHIASPNINPAFDITPAKNITGIITPNGILKPPLKKAIEKYIQE